MVKVEFFKSDEHYQFLIDWWKAQNWAVIPLSHLPYLGFISYVGEKPAAACFLYQTDSAFCLMEWIVANPEVRRAERSEALDALIQRAKDGAKAMGFKTIFMSARNASLIHRLEKQGFTVNEKSMANLTHTIQEG